MSFIGTGHIGSGFIGRFVETVAPIFGFPSVVELDDDDAAVLEQVDDAAVLEQEELPEAILSMAQLPEATLSLTDNASSSGLIDQSGSLV